MRAELKEVRDQLTRRMHLPFRDQVRRHWRRTLRRRSQKTRLNWERMDRITTRWLPRARVIHPFPKVRFAATHPR